MVFISSERMNAGLLARFARRRFAPNRFDLIAFLLIGGLAVLVVHGARQMNLPLSRLHNPGVVLDPRRLPQYALRSTLRLFAPVISSLSFTFWIPTLAPQITRARSFCIPPP